MHTPLLASLQVGLPRVYGQPGAAAWMDQPWQTGFFKEIVDGPRWLSRTNLQGDGQADLDNHGGPDKAVLAYAAEHYPAWRAELGRPDLPHGAFGENFTIDGLTEATVCIGDLYRVGDVLVQVSQPRQPCWKLARRWRIKELTALVDQTGRTGWYLRVLEEGEVAPGLPLTLLDRPHPAWTVTRATSVMRRRRQTARRPANSPACRSLPSPGAKAWRQQQPAGRSTGCPRAPPPEYIRSLQWCRRGRASGTPLQG